MNQSGWCGARVAISADYGVRVIRGVFLGGIEGIRPTLAIAGQQANGAEGGLQLDVVAVHHEGAFDHAMEAVVPNGVGGKRKVSHQTEESGRGGLGVR